jgi:competence protein ComFB
MNARKYHNALEDVIEKEINNTAKKDKSFCGCPQCKIDVMALTLNNLLPRYIVHNQTKVFLKKELSNPDLIEEIKRTIQMAIKKVKDNPMHDEEQLCFF